MYVLPVIPFVTMILVLVFAFISLGLSSFTIVTHVTTQTNKSLTYQEDFNNLTIEGKLTVEGGVIFTEGLSTKKGMSVSTEIKSVELDTRTFSFGGSEVPVEDFKKLKNQADWFRVFLNPLDTMKFVGQITSIYNSFPFGRTMNDQNISAVGPVANDHFLISPDNTLGVTATFTKFTNPKVLTSTWLVEGSFGIDFIPEQNSQNFQKPTAVEAILAGTFLKNRLSSPINTYTVISRINDIKGFPQDQQYLNQMYNFAPSVVTFPLLTPNDNKLCEYVGLNIFFGLANEQMVGITIKNMEFTFKKLHETLV
jgi:hypothetical protein